MRGLRRPAVAWLVAGLLLLQAGILVLTELLIVTTHSAELREALGSVGGMLAALTYLALVPGAGLALAAVLGVLIVPSRSWLPAMLAQVLTLAGCLWIYWDLGRRRPLAVYPLIVLSVVAVLYLNSSVVRTTMLPIRRAGRDVADDA